MTALCIPIFIKSGLDLEEAITTAEEALDGTDGMLELRCDTATPKQMLEAIDLARLPVIVTIRPTWEGGHSHKTDPQRLAMWEESLDAGADYIDVELVAWEKNAKIRDTLSETAEKAGTRLILSNHDFSGRPADLPDRLKRLHAIKPAHILKIAWKAHSILDAIDALRLSSQLPILNCPLPKDPRPIVALAMGEQGLISRLLARTTGTPFTFAALDNEKQSAPGQPTIHELRTRYRWDHQTKTSPIFGVIGWPVSHSLSPHIHNAGFDATDSPGIYVPLAIQPDYTAFSAALDALRNTLPLHGLSITIPHKENAFRYLTEHAGSIDPLSKKLGVINTLLWHGKKLHGLNSDYDGALDALASAWTGQRSDVAGKRIAVLGAGGAARAIVAALAAHGATVIIYNRTHEKAEKLAAEFTGKTGKVVAAPWEKICDSCAEAYINCTPLGMHPNIKSSPIDFDPNWTSETVIFDTVYNPLMTRFLKQAQAKGAKIIPGTEMFIRQAAIQFKEFTGQPAPLDIFRKTLLEALQVSSPQSHRDAEDAPRKQ